MADSFAHPIFNDPHTRMLSLCGRLETNDQAILSVVEGLGDRVLIFCHGEGDDAEFFGLFGGSSENGDKKHVHLDVVRGSFFEGEERPSVTNTEGEVADIWAKLFGQRVNVAVTGRFLAPLADFAPDSVVRKLADPQDVDGIRIRQTAASYEFTGQHLQGFNWSLSTKTERVRVVVRLTLDEVINEAYPKKLYDQAIRIFKTAILQGKSDGR